LAPTPEVALWFSDLLHRELDRWVALTQTQIGQLYQHYELLVRWNQRMNLTTVGAGPEMVIRHYCESLFFGAHLPAGRNDISVLDLGSGAGFPGVPLAVLKPSWHVILVEASQRKAVFLRESTRHLHNVRVLAQRLENLVETADWAVARAVEPLQILANIPRLAPNVGLMLTEGDFSLLHTKSHIAWEDPVRLPWGDRKICVFGCST
jgi:16S rRNA (guanine(527)-N(7))-methyltransferase RsmG